MSLCPLFPELDMIGAKRSGIRKPKPKQYVLFYHHDYERYTLTVKRQTPKWADKKAIAAVYKEARRMTREGKVLFVVDHIVPLQGGIVCGLHVSDNLRIVPWEVNASKGARYWPDMPGEQGELYESQTGT